MKARLPMRTRRSPLSSISEICRISWSVKPRCLRGVEQDLGVDRVDELHVARQQAFEQRTGQLSSASGSSVWLV